jgi:hypothetical protein
VVCGHHLSRLPPTGCLGHVIIFGSLSAQRAIWAQHNIAIDFAGGKMMLPDVKVKFVVNVYYHIGDREDLDRKYALDAGFEFLWPHEAMVHPWFL